MTSRPGRRAYDPAPGDARTESALRRALSEARGLIADRTPASAAPPESLAALLDEARALLAEPRPAAPIRSIHHLACTGGTILSRCVAAMQNVRMLSEVDPLSPLANKPERHFWPADMTGLLAFGSPRGDWRLRRDAFMAGLAAVYEHDRRRGVDLVVRDHVHSQFTCDGRPEGAPLLIDMLEDRFAATACVVTVRHPLDSFASLSANGWRHFTPFDIDGYATRYHAFLDRFDGAPIVRYEDFTAEPAHWMRRICDALALRFNPAFEDSVGVITLSGDSGRRSSDIQPRSRRAEAAALASDAARSAQFGNLLDRLGYSLDETPGSRPAAPPARRSEQAP